MSIDNDKVTKIFCMADDFCRVYDRFVKADGLAPKRDKSKRRYHRDGRLSDAEVITIMILFHLGGYKCLKHFYLNEVCRNMTDLFLALVSYNRFVELERKVVVPFILFVNRCCMGACTGISFVDGIQLITKLKSNMKSQLMTVSDKILLRKRALIETINGELKNIAQIEHSRHRSVVGFTVNLMADPDMISYLKGEIPFLNLREHVKLEEQKWIRKAKRYSLYEDQPYRIK